MADQPLLKDLPCEKNYPVAHLLRVSNFELKKTKKGDDYLLFKVSDATKSLTCKRWNSTATDLDRYKDCKALFITGKVDPYNSEVSIVADSIAEPEEEAAEKFLEGHPEPTKTAPTTPIAMVSVSEKQCALRDYKGKDTPVSGLFRIFGAELKIGKKSPFLVFKLGDKSGELGGKRWESTQEDLDKLKDVRTAFIIGKIDDYGNTNSVIATTIEPRNISDDEFSQLFVSTKYSINFLKKEIWGYIQRIQNKYIRILAENILKDPLIKERFSTSVAAVSLHHNYRGGLCTHVFRNMKVGEALVDGFNNNMYPDGKYKINKDIVIFLALCHDIFKTYEYNPDGTYSQYGGLVPHLPKGAIFAERKMDAIPNFPEELRTQLSHGLLSHHGEEKFGSPVTPKTVEAVLFHYIDYMCSKIDPMLENLDRLSEGVLWTDPIKALAFGDNGRANPAYMGGMLLSEIGSLGDTGNAK